MSIASYARVARAPFLALPFTLIAVGTGAAAYAGQVNWAYAGLALLGLLGMHVAVNALNEASDFKRGIDLQTERTPFSGGSGTLPAGTLGYRHAVTLGLVGGAVGVVVGVFFSLIYGWTLLPILAVGAVAAFVYSNVLARGYVGELFAGLGLGALPVIGTTLVQTGGYEAASIAASIPAFLMTFNLLLLNEFPDEEADRAGGRRNLVLLLGRTWSARLYIIAAVLVPVLILVSVGVDSLPLLAAAAIVPSAVFLPKPVGWGIRAPNEPVPIPALGANVVWILSTNLVLGIALYLAAVL
jgi:1,4-dihydroxy-2-naphthoate octaprenyltransferase